MGWITTEEVKKIRKSLKTSELTKDFKFSVRGGNSPKLYIKIISGPIDLGIEHKLLRAYRYEDKPEVSAVLKEVLDIALEDYYDNSDIQTDYFDVAFYYDIEIGSYDKPYEVKQSRNQKPKVKQNIKTNLWMGLAGA